MRLVNVLLAFGIGLSANAQQDGAPTRSECIESLQIPKYPVVARSAQISGTARAQVVVFRGTVSAIDFNEGVSPVLRDSVERSLKASRFSPNCDHSVLKLVFAFVIEGTPVAYQDLGTVSFRWPNEFTISVHPAVPNAEIENLGAPKKERGKK